jgi:hypothetical protein
MSAFTYDASFWEAVTQCLEKFRGFSREAAVQSVRRLTDGLAGEAAEDQPDFIYHEEPYFIAANLAGATPRTIGQDTEEYERLMNDVSRVIRHEAEPAAARVAEEP